MMINKKNILLLLLCVTQLSFGRENRSELSEEWGIDKSRLIYLSSEMRRALLGLPNVLPDYEWSCQFKSLCEGIRQGGCHFVEYESILEVLDECFIAIGLHERVMPLESIKSDIQTYEKELVLNNEIYRQNCSLKRICNLAVRFLAVINRLIVFGNKTVNGMLTVNGPLIINGNSVGTGSVTSVSGGIGITITGNPAINPTVNLTVPVAIANGGTNATSMTNTDGVVYYDGTRLNTTTVGTAGQVLTSQGPGLAPTFVSRPTVTSVSAGTGITITGNPAINPTVSLTVPVVIAHGGTNATSMTNTDGVVYFDGTLLNTTAVGTAGQILTSNGAGVAPTFQAPAHTGTVTSVSGGTGITITGNPAVNPTVNLTVPVAIANGGTNATSMTNTDGVVYFDGTRLNTTTVGTAGQVLTSNGAGNAPTFQIEGVASIAGDTGGPLTGALTLTGGTSGLTFAGAGTTLTMNLSKLNLPTTTSSVGQVTIGGSPFLHAGGSLTNVFIGQGAGNFTNTGSDSTGIGPSSLVALTTGILNTGIGANTLNVLTTAQNNIAIGSGAGVNVVFGSNIEIANAGAGSFDDSNLIRIGTQGTGTGQQNRCFIAGIENSTVVGSPVLVSSTGQLGLVTSSRRYKENIKDVDEDTLAKVLGLRSVTFNYKEAKVADEVHYGLIAEEVVEILDHLVIYDENNKPYTVKYHELPVLLLAVIKRLSTEIEALKANLAEMKADRAEMKANKIALKARIAALEAQ